VANRFPAWAHGIIENLLKDWGVAKEISLDDFVKRGYIFLESRKKKRRENPCHLSLVDRHF
jgi:hypothetical protein